MQKHAKWIAEKYPKTGNGTTLIKMQHVIEKFTIPAYLQNVNDPWWDNAKLTDEWLDVIFREFYKEMNLPQDFFKRDYYQLIHLLEPHEIDPEIVEKLGHHLLNLLSNSFFYIENPARNIIGRP